MDKIKLILDNHVNLRQDSLLLRRILQEIVETVDLKEYISCLLSDKHILAQISKLSYKHANGFFKIVLHASENYKLRLHIWRKDEKAYHEDIHNHRWNFASYVLIGGYRNEIYEEANSGILKYKYFYYPRLSKTNFILEYKGVKHLELVERIVFSADSYLVLDCHVLHKVNLVESDYTATLFLAGSALDDHTQIYSDDLIIDSNEIDSPNISIFDLENIFIELISKCKNGNTKYTS
ncbi:hypothetical protein [Spirosoma aerolatum]|uniref:hypothetical protein n=1 Tax=Spirosoma aerolatum TaxID=1211326 RepID=UPI0009AD9942|nr:hypothetical protein [Spirosoma aerolatum]